MCELKGKKLLVLGGNALTSDIVLKAKELGVYTIVTDWNTPDGYTNSCCPDLKSDSRLKNIGEKFTAGLDEIKRLNNPHKYYIDLSHELWNLRNDMLKSYIE